MSGGSTVRHKAVMPARRVARYVLITAVATLAACSTAGDVLTVTDVKPWERGTLARDDMQLVNDALELQVDEHIYFSKEASTGGVSVQGGGCGCN